MAKVIGPGLSFGLRGSVGGVQYRKTKRGNVVCLYRNKPLTVSAPQAVVRACMTTITTLYHTLSAVQLSAWRTYGTAFDFRWGGFAYFTYINMPLARAGDPLSSWPPGYPYYTSAYPPAQSDVYVKATSKRGTGYWPYFATDPAKSLIGNMDSNSWCAVYNTITDQRFHIDLGSAKVIKRIYYENGHHIGANVYMGAENFTFWGSNTAADFADLVYGNDGTWVSLATSQSTFDAHVFADTPDPKFITVVNDVAYRYYGVKIADNYGNINIVDVRRIELQQLFYY